MFLIVLSQLFYYQERKFIHVLRNVSKEDEMCIGTVYVLRCQDKVHMLDLLLMDKWMKYLCHQGALAPSNGTHPLNPCLPPVMAPPSPNFIFPCNHFVSIFNPMTYLTNSTSLSFKLQTWCFRFLWGNLCMKILGGN